MPPCWILHRAVNASGLTCSLGRATAAQLLGHAGKYIPGKAMVVVLRVDAIAKDRGESIRAASSVFFETLLMMGVGGLVAGVLLARAELPLWVRSMAVLMAIGSAIPVCPPVMRKLVSLLQKKEDGPPSTDGLTWSLLASSVAASLVSWLLIGMSFTLLVMAIPSIESTPNLASLFPSPRPQSHWAWYLVSCRCCLAVPAFVSTSLSWSSPPSSARHMDCSP